MSSVIRHESESTQSGNTVQQRRLRQFRAVMLAASLPLVVASALKSTPEDNALAATTSLSVQEMPTQQNVTTADTVTQGSSVLYSDGVTPFGSLIEQSATAFSVDACLIGAITERESGGQVYVESGGTYGLMQLDPSTAQYMVNEHSIPYDGNLYDPQLQFDIGAAILADAERDTGIDTNTVLDESSLAAVGIYYHGIGFYHDFVNGRQLPANVIEAADRLQKNYSEYCE